MRKCVCLGVVLGNHGKIKVLSCSSSGAREPLRVRQGVEKFKELSEFK